MPRPASSVRRVLVVTALVLGAWAAVIAISGGGVLMLGPLRLSSRSAGRPALAGLLLFAGAVATMSADERRRGLARARALLDDAAPWLAATLAIGIGVVSAVFNEHAAHGADAAGYLSQSRMWMDGDVTLDAPSFTDDPWPQRGWLVSPLGFAPAATPGRLGPTYAPGLPWLMALGAAVAGEAGRFVWTPLAVAALVALTFLLARRTTPPAIALAAALLVATSAPVLFAAMQTMSDLLCAALWTLALVAVTRPGRASTTVAALAAGLALAVRPNLVPLAALFGLAAFATDTAPWRERLGRAVVLALPMAAVALAVAVINASLWGSPFSSGYGATEDLFIAARVPGNLARVWRWTAATRGWWMLLGLAAVAGLAAVRPRREWRLGLALVAGVAVSYLPYALFEEWWYLRFYLPVWPVAGAAVVTAAWLALRRLSEAGAPIVVLIGVLAQAPATIAVADAAGTFDLWRGARRSATVAGHVATEAPAGTLVLAVQHSGSLHYAGAAIGRWDYIPAHALDSLVDALARRGRPVWLVVDDFEVAPFQARFAGTRRGALDWAPLAEARVGTARTRIYDLTTPTRAVAPALIRVVGSGARPWNR